MPASSVAKAIGGHAHAADATREEDVRGTFRAAKERLGDRLHGVVDIIGMPTGAGLEQTGGPPPFSKAERSRFLSALEQSLKA